MRQVDIKGFEDYQVTDDGRVWSKKSNKWMKQRLDRYGYPRISFHDGDKVLTFTIHRLVAKHFIPNPTNLPCINHKDECKTNNVYTNLEYCSVAENNAHGTRTQRASASMIGKSHQGVINREDESIPVCQYTTDGVFVAEYPSINDAARKYNVVMQAISNCCRHKSKTSCGYVWKYKNDQPN